MVGAKRLSVVIPALNEEESLPAVLAELPRDIVDEVLVVDGHSTDRTVEVAKNHVCRVITQQGAGYGKGVMTGIREAQGELLVFMDADGSYNPQALYKLAEKITEGCDIVFCSRYLPGAGTDDDTWVRKLGNFFFTKLLRMLFGVRLSDALFFYALGKREVFESLPLISSDYSLCVEVPILVHQMGFRYTEIPSKERARIAGQSKVNALIDGFKILHAMLRFKLREFRTGSS